MGATYLPIDNLPRLDTSCRILPTNLPCINIRALRSILCPDILAPMFHERTERRLYVTVASKPFSCHHPLYNLEACILLPKIHTLYRLDMTMFHDCIRQMCSTI